MNSSTVYLSVLMLAIGLGAKAQSDVAVLEQQNQACLDRGENMMDCSQHFYYQMDSLLNVYYKRLTNSCNSIERVNLQDDEMGWLAQRDIYFKRTKSDYLKGDPAGIAGGSRDAQMVMYQQNADYVKKRVLVLSSAKAADFSPAEYHVDPTGYYTLDTRVKGVDGEIRGFVGDIEVKKLSKSRIVLRLAISGRGPEQGEGLILDTLRLIANSSVYRPPVFIDSTCIVDFMFMRRGVRVKQIADNPNGACGLGQGAIVTGFYTRKSSRMPSDKELLKY